MTSIRFPDCHIHPTALLEDGVTLGPGTFVWDNVHIRHGTKIGRDCIIGEKSCIAYDVSIGDYCKLNTAVYVCTGVSIENHVMLSAHVVFTNDRFPRAFDKFPTGLATSGPTEDTLSTRVGKGVTVGASATIGPGLDLGDFSMVGMGSVVTHDVPSYGLVIGNPARLAGFVCACGRVLVKIQDWEKDAGENLFTCEHCGMIYARSNDGIVERERPQCQRSF